MNTKMIHARVPQKTAEDAEKILKKLGITMSAAVRALLSQITLEKGIPFESRIPNRATKKAIKDYREGKNYTTYKSVDEMMKKYKT